MLDRLGVVNFKKFVDASFDLGHLTLLTGLNGAGKSTVIQTLAVLRQSYESGALDSGFVDLNGSYVRIGTGSDALCENFAGQQEIAFSLTRGGETCTVTMEGRLDADHLPAVVSGSLEGTALVGNEFQHIRADRLGPETQYERSYDQAVRRGRLGPRGEFAVDRLLASNDVRVPAARCHPSGESDRLIDQVSAWIGQTCPGVTLFTVPVSNTDLVRLEVGFGGTAGFNASNRYRPTNVGFGVSYVLPIVVACLTAAPGSLLLIENPEAHLHPRGQSHMARLCSGVARDGVQLVVESHSDHFLNGLRLAVKGAADGEWVRIHYFGTPDEQGFRSIGVDARGLLSEWPEGFFDESQQLLAELLAP